MGAVATQSFPSETPSENVRTLASIHSPDGGPPSFFQDDLQKWRHKFEQSNKSAEDSQKQYQTHFHYSFGPRAKRQKGGRAGSGFSNVDPILLRGNAGEVGTKWDDL